MEFVKGIYRHYKGNLYELLSVAKHSETLEPVIVYKALYDGREVWVRPAKMWNEEIEVNGEKVQRFKLVERFL